jgi:hypothetical protein
MSVRAVAIRSPPGTISSQLCSEDISARPESHFTAENPAGASNWLLMFSMKLAILLRLGDHRCLFWIGEKSAPALLALGHAVPGKHVDDLLAALADQCGPKDRPGGCRASPRSAASRSRTATAAPICALARSGRSAIHRSCPLTLICVNGWSPLLSSEQPQTKVVSTAILRRAARE